MKEKYYKSSHPFITIWLVPYYTLTMSNIYYFQMNFSILLIYTLASTTEPFNAEKAFLALSVVNILRFPLTMIPFVITGVIQVRKDQE